MPFEAEVLIMPHYHYDASLLFRRMILLQIDRRELARDGRCCCESSRVYALCVAANPNRA